MPKVRGGKLSCNNKENTRLMKPRKSVAASNILCKKLDELHANQVKEFEILRSSINNESQVDDDDDDDDGYQYDNDDNDDYDNIDNGDESDDTSTSKNNHHISTHSKYSSPMLSKNRDTTSSNIINTQDNTNVPAWANELLNAHKEHRSEFKQFVNKFEDWITTIQPLLDVNLLTSTDIPKIIPFQYVDDLRDFEHSTNGERLEMIHFLKNFCIKDAQSSANEMLINSFGPEEWITPFVTTEGKGPMHPRNLPAMIKTKFADCVFAALSLKTNRFEKPLTKDFKPIFEASLKVMKNRRKRLESSGKVEIIDKDQEVIPRPRLNLENQQ